MDTQPETIPSTETTPEENLAAVRALIIETIPNIVPELVTGSTVSQLFESIDDARSVFERIARDANALQVPAGGNSPLLVNADQLPTAEKIRRGLAAARPRN